MLDFVNYNLEAFLDLNKENVETFLKLCEQIIDLATSNPKSAFKLKSAVHELLINALEHGYDKNFGKVSLSISKNKNMITLEVKDEGIGFDPSTLNFESEISDLEMVNERGWGLLVIKKLCENLEIGKNLPCGTRVKVDISV